MDMELGTAIIGAIAIIICALPFVMMSRNRKNREKKFLKALSEIAAKNKCTIDQHEIFGNFAIGIDETKNFVFFYKLKKDKELKQSVDLSEVKNCKVINTSRPLKGENQKAIDKLELGFIPSVKNGSEIKFEFFNSDVNLQLFGELQAIEKWSKLINDQLNQKV